MDRSFMKDIPPAGEECDHSQGYVVYRVTATEIHDPRMSFGPPEPGDKPWIREFYTAHCNMCGADWRGERVHYLIPVNPMYKG